MMVALFFLRLFPVCRLHLNLMNQVLMQNLLSQLNETTLGSTDVKLIQNSGPYNESAYDFIATDAEDGDLHDAVTATPNVIDNPSLIDTTTINETGYVVEYNVIDSAR